MTLGMLIGLLNAFGGALALVNGVLETPFEFDSAEVLVGHGPHRQFRSGMGVALLLLQIAISQLTFDADNRTTGVRLGAAGIFWLALAWQSAWARGMGGDRSSCPSVPVRFRIHSSSSRPSQPRHWGALGRLGRGDRDGCPVEAACADGHNCGLLAIRLLLTPLMPGGARGYLYVTLHLAALATFVIAANLITNSSVETAWNYLLGLCGYVAFYLGLGSAVARLARRTYGDFRPAHARVVTLLLVALGSILPQTLYFFDAFRTASRPQYWITDPFHTLTNLANGHTESSMLIWLLGGGTAAVILLNTPSLIHLDSSVNRLAPRQP